MSCAKIHARTSKNIAPTLLSNLVFKFNIVLMGIFLKIISFTIYLLFCLLVNIWYITDVEVNPGPLRFFIRTSKVLMRLGVLFLKVFIVKMFCVLIFSWKILKNDENYPWCQKLSLISLFCARAGRFSAC